MAAMAAAEVRRARAHPGWGLALVAGGILHALAAERWPMLDVALVALGLVVLVPQVPRAILVAGVAVAPTFNPALTGLGQSGVGSGRVYAFQAALLLVIVGGLVAAARARLPERVTVAVAVLGVVVVSTVGRSHAGPAWVYRPLQLFLVAFAVRALYARRSHRVLLLALAWGAFVGCALAAANALVPAFDPFARSRPSDIPFVSAIGNFTRATGAFTYPNNLGTFAAYAVLLGAAAWLFGRPALPRALAGGLVVAGGASLVLSGSRAAGAGLVVGVLYLTSRLSRRRLGLVLCAEALAGLVVVLGVLSSPSALDVARERLDTAAGQSLDLRLEGSTAAWHSFTASPLVGTGANEGRTDNFWLSYLAQTGIVGAALFGVLARAALRARRCEAKGYPELWVALLAALAVSGLLQDSLGQTLVTWFLGALVGMCALEPASSR